MGFGVSYVLHLVVLFSLMFVCAWSQDDGAVMQKLKNKISGVNWSDKDFCEWGEVTCSGAKRVTKIQIPQNLTVHGSLPQELVQLT
jgi:hypothetical protein